MLEFERVIEDAEKILRFKPVGRLLTEIAKNFTDFYHTCKVAGSERENVRRAIVEAFVKIFSEILWILGIPEIEKI